MATKLSRYLYRELKDHRERYRRAGVAAERCWDVDDPSLIARLNEAVGYTLRICEPNWQQHRMFNGPDTNANIHIFTAADPEIERMVEFRDRLRKHDDDRELYAAVKRRLAPRRWRHIQHYADAKSGVIEQILAWARDSPG